MLRGGMSHVVSVNYCCTDRRAPTSRETESKRERVGMVVKRRKESKEAQEKKSALDALLETY
jgi:hypothetical protein